MYSGVDKVSGLNVLIWSVNNLMVVIKKFDDKYLWHSPGAVNFSKYDHTILDLSRFENIELIWSDNLMQYPIYRLNQPLNHGNFTPGRDYACLKLTNHGNGGQRGFYWDDLGDVRMVPADAFSPTDAVWKPPVPRALSTAERNTLAERWGVTPLTVSNWMTPDSASYQPIRFADALRGSQLAPRTDHLTSEDLRTLIEGRGFYIQEIAVRWNTQQFADRIKRMIIEQPGLFWDLWRGMIHE